jgi:glutamyl-Q tRNA(Asp) synthetase
LSPPEEPDSDLDSELGSEVGSTATSSKPALEKHYRGRFAPSPTGPLHFGSLVAAVGSYLQSRSQNGRWFLRFDDLDLPRNQAGATDAILRSLHSYGFEWDGEVYYQQNNIDHYQAALDTLLDHDMCYRCVCSRKTVQQAMQQQQREVYPGSCRNLRLQDAKAAIRICAPAEAIQFLDTVQGNFSQQLAQDVGDFIIRRADQIFAYQLAVVVDDHIQAISEVVRGADLLDNTPRQIYLQRCLKYKTPDYVHLPIAVNHAGQKLSKQTDASAISDNNISATLYQALKFLGQNPPESLQFEFHRAVWQWAITNWKIVQVQMSSSVTSSA